MKCIGFDYGGNDEEDAVGFPSLDRVVFCKYRLCQCRWDYHPGTAHLHTTGLHRAALADAAA